MASQITSHMIVYSTVYSGTGQRKHRSSASLAFVRGIHRWPVNSPHKWSVTRKMLPFDDVIMNFMTWVDHYSFRKRYMYSYRMWIMSPSTLYEWPSRHVWLNVTIHASVTMVTYFFLRSGMLSLTFINTTSSTTALGANCDEVLHCEKSPINMNVSPSLRKVLE